DDQRLGALGAQVPGEPGLIVVGVNRPGQAEHEAGELALDGGDGGVDLVAALNVGQRVDVAGVGVPHLIDQLAPGRRVGLVPAVQVAGDDVVHVGVPFVMAWSDGVVVRCRYPMWDATHPADGGGAVS